jgi:hypothetical protein
VSCCSCEDDAEPSQYHFDCTPLVDAAARTVDIAKAHFDTLELRDKAAQRRSEASFRIGLEGIGKVEAIRLD